MIENEITNLSALVGSIKSNAEKIGGGGDAGNLVKGITDMCEIADGKLLLVEKEISEVKKDV